MIVTSTDDSGYNVQTRELRQHPQYPTGAVSTIVKKSDGSIIVSVDNVPHQPYGRRYNVDVSGECPGNSIPKSGEVIRVDIPPASRDASTFIVEDIHARLPDDIYSPTCSDAQDFVSYDYVVPPSSVVCIPEIPIILSTQSRFKHGTTIVDAPIQHNQDESIQFPDARNSFEQVFTMPSSSRLHLKVDVPDKVLVGLRQNNLGTDFDIFDAGTFDKVYAQNVADSIMASLSSNDLILKSPPSFRNVTVTNGSISHDFVCSATKVTNDPSMSDVQIRECGAMMSGAQAIPLGLTLLQVSPLSDFIPTITTTADKTLVSSRGGIGEKIYSNPFIIYTSNGDFNSKCNSDCDTEVKDGILAPFSQSDGRVLLLVEPDNLENSGERDAKEVLQVKSWNDKSFGIPITLLSYKNGASSASIVYNPSTRSVTCSLDDGVPPISDPISSSDDSVDATRPFSVGFGWGGLHVDCLLNNAKIGSGFITQSQFVIPGQKFAIGGPEVGISTRSNTRSEIDHKWEYQFKYYFDVYSYDATNELYCAPKSSTSSVWTPTLDFLQGTKGFLCEYVQKKETDLTSLDVGIGGHFGENSGKLIWTGTKCCGEQSQIPEYYNDPLKSTSAGVLDDSTIKSSSSAGACWGSTFVLSGNSELSGRYINNEDQEKILGGSVININGTFVGCAINDPKVLEIQDIHTKSNLIPQSKNYSVCSVVNASLQNSLSPATPHMYALCQPGSSGGAGGVWITGSVGAGSLPSDFDGSNPEKVSLSSIRVKRIVDTTVQKLSNTNTPSFYNGEISSNVFSRNSTQGEELFNLSYDEGGVRMYRSASSCCGPNSCWDGTANSGRGQCIQEQSHNNNNELYPSKDKKYRCEKILPDGNIDLTNGVATWVEKVERPAPDYGDSGFCPMDTQCFTKNQENSIVGNRTIWYTSDTHDTFWCAEPGTYFTFKGSDDLGNPRDVLCESGGSWSSRSLLLSSALYDIGKANNNFELFCGSREDIESTSAGADVASLTGTCNPVDVTDIGDSCISTICVLKMKITDGKNVSIIGTILNIPINGTIETKSFLKSLGSTTNTECTNAPSTGFTYCTVAGKNVVYNRELQIVLFSKDFTTLTPPTTTSKSLLSKFYEFRNTFNYTIQNDEVRDALYMVGGSGDAYSNYKELFFRSDFSKLYVSQKGSASTYSMFTKDTFVGVPSGDVKKSALFGIFEGANNAVLTNLKKQYMGVYNDSSGTYYIVANDESPLLTESDSSWKDVMSKLRIIEGTS